LTSSLRLGRKRLCKLSLHSTRTHTQTGIHKHGIILSWTPTFLKRPRACCLAAMATTGKDGSERSGGGEGGGKGSGGAWTTRVVARAVATATAGLVAATARDRCHCSRRHEQVVQVVCAVLQHKGHMHHKLWERDDQKGWSAVAASIGAAAAQ
jgi:hypothetical protein